MIQSFNPIQEKLTKMRSSKVINMSQKSDNTPIKSFDWQTHFNTKQNVNAFVMVRNLNTECHNINNDSYTRKLSLLKKRNSQKEESNIFYKKQIIRRKQKHQKQLLENQQKYEQILMGFQHQLIDKMKKENETDNQMQQLQVLINEIEGNRNMDNIHSIITKIDTSLLEQIQRKLLEKGVIESELLYSKQTLNPMNDTLKKDFMSYSMQSNAISTYNKHSQFRNKKIQFMRTSNDWNQSEKSFNQQSFLAGENNCNGSHNFSKKKYI